MSLPSKFFHFFLKLLLLLANFFVTKNSEKIEKKYYNKHQVFLVLNCTNFVSLPTSSCEQIFFKNVSINLYSTARKSITKSITI